MRAPTQRPLVPVGVWHADSRVRRRGTLVIVAVALVGSVVVNVLLAHRLRSLSNARSERIAEYRLKVDTAMPQIPVKRLDGQREMISYQGSPQPTVLYIFTPPCSWCMRNLDNLKTLVDKAGGEYRFIGLSLSEEGLSQYVAKNHLKLPIYAGLSTATQKTYKLGRTPQTIVISPQGRVVQDWVGAYVGGQKSQIEAFFHVTLPGLRELPKAEKSEAESATQGVN